MKRILLIFAIVFGAIVSAQVQNNLDWKKMSPEQRRDLIQKMSPEERIQMLKKYKENMVIQELNIPLNKQEEFKKLFEEYQESQKTIKEQFRLDNQTESLTDAEAKKKLQQSFVVGQQLLDNREKYAEKFLKIISPQQVLRLFQSEGMMREKMLDKKKQGQNRDNLGGRKPQFP